MIEAHFIRLVTGEDIVTEILAENQWAVYIDRPFKIVYMTTGGNPQMSIALSPWVLGNLVDTKDLGLEVLKRDILFETNASASLNQYYNKAADYMSQILDTEDDEEESDKTEYEMGEPIIKTEGEISEEVRQKLEEFVKSADQRPDKKKMN